MTTLRNAIRAIYDQVAAPEWAALNLDALADILRDLSWLPEGTVALQIPAVFGSDYDRLLAALLLVVDDTVDSPHPVLLIQ
jgi:hypothetical protein